MNSHNLIFSSSKAVLEIHDELAAQIQNSTEAVEYIDGVSSIAEEDDLSTLMSIQEDKSVDGEKKDEDEEEEVQIDTFRVIGVRRSPGESLVSYTASAQSQCFQCAILEFIWRGFLAQSRLCMQNILTLLSNYYLVRTVTYKEIFSNHNNKKIFPS